MPFSKNIIPEFWHHKERVAGKKGQQYIFRSKWFLLIQVICALTLIPLLLSTYFFYKTNRTETITDLLLETDVLAKGAAVDIELFFDQYLATLRIISSEYPPDILKQKLNLNSLLKIIGQTNIRFSSLNIIDKNGRFISCCGNTPDTYLTGHQQLDLKELNIEKDYFIDQIIMENGTPAFLVSLRLTQNNGENFFLAGIIDNKTTAMFLERLKVKDVLDIYIMDSKGGLLTPSTFFGEPGPRTTLPEFSSLTSSEVLTNPNKKKDRGDFLFSGLSQIGSTDMKLGIIMSNRSFRAFMTRIRTHILTMTFLSIFFVAVAVLLLVTYVVQVLYRADKIRQVYLTKAARNSKMASIGQLAAGVAHEINNPLAIINEKAGLLLDLFSFTQKYKTDEQLSSIVEAIIAAVERAGTITHRLLGFARKTDSSVQTINVNETVQEVLGFVRKEAEYKSIHIHTHISDHFPKIISDRGKLQQILLNLVNNAIAALNENGTLTIRARHNTRNESIELFVQDNGCGISRDHQKKIFEPFFTTKNKIGGTGLGLSLTYGLIRDLHGTLAFESEPDVGTTFTITLPYEIKKEEPA